MIHKVRLFLKDELWRIRIRKLPPRHSFFIRALRVLMLSLRQFEKDNCQLRASALTFFSLLSIVPVFAMAFGIAKGFGLEKGLETQVLEKMEGQEEVVRQVIDFSKALLENTKGGVVAGIGVVFLFWTIIKVMGQIEQSFNDIWGVKKSRSLGRKFTDYLSLMLICPLLLILSSSVNVFIVSQISHPAAGLEWFGALRPLVMTCLRIFPYLVIWGLLSFIYVYMPNTRVKMKSALLAGVMAGTLYQAVQWAYIHFQIGVANYGAIYGSFAALPLFLVWLQMSWLIVLFGAEVSFAHQNVDTFEFESECLSVSQSFRKVLALRIVRLCVERFEKGATPLTDDEISDCLEIPIRLVRQILYDLKNSQVLTEVRTAEERETAYQPACSVDLLTLSGVLQKLESYGLDSLPVLKDEDYKVIEEKLAKLKIESENSPSNVPLKNLTNVRSRG